MTVTGAEHKKSSRSRRGRCSTLAIGTYAGHAWWRRLGPRCCGILALPEVTIHKDTNMFVNTGYVA